MKFSLSWLHDHLDTTATGQQIADGLLQLGHEVEEVVDEAAAFNNVVIGYVKERVQHPDADKLGVCTVDVGEGADRQIVCGAPNVRGGLTVAVALEGATLPNGMKIEPRKVRGVTSNGMICSAAELGLGDDHSGIMELETHAKPGDSFAEAMSHNDVVFDLALTPNRGDCFNVRGLARDLAALGLGKLNEISVPKLAHFETTAPQSKTEGCSYFGQLEVKFLKNQPSPAYIQRRLEQAGLRPRNILVDITNFILLDLGQPLHAYDGAKVALPLYCREAEEGEAYAGLNDTNLKLNKGDLVICDQNGIVGLAGILGGATSGVTDSTETVILEGALFNRAQIALTGQAHGVLSDARTRFERGVDPATVDLALQRAAAMMVEFAGEHVQVSSLASTGTTNVETATIDFNPTMVQTFGGLEVSVKRITEILQSLGFTVAQNGENLSVTAPTWRTYMSTPEDLVEEVVRVHGLDDVQPVLPALPLAPQQPAPARVQFDRAMRTALVQAGAMEVQTYSFIPQKVAQACAPGVALIEVANPIDAATMTTMRPSLLPGLLMAAQENTAHSDEATFIAEVGTVFTAQEERQHAAFLLTPSSQRHWQQQSTAPDVYAAKGRLLQALAALGVGEHTLQIEADAGALAHPGQSFKLKQGKLVVAWAGSVHPSVLKTANYKGKAPVFGCIDLTALEKVKARAPKYAPMDYPPVTRDLAFVVPADVTAGDIQRSLTNAAKPLLQSINLFDMYQGEQIAAGHKSVAFALTLRSADRTLSEDEITEVMDNCVATVRKNYNAELREA